MTRHIAILLVLTLTAAAADHAPRLASVDMQRLIARYWKFPLAQKRIKATQQTLQQKLDGLQEDVGELARQARALELEIESPVVKDAADKKARLQQLQQTLQQKQQSLAQTERRFQQELLQLRDKEHNTILNEVKAVVNAYARQQHIDFVFDSSGMTRPGNGLVFAGARHDITAAVLELLNGEPAEVEATDKARAEGEAKDNTGPVNIQGIGGGKKENADQ